MTLFIKRSKTMFQRILVPLDGSARAERALPVAARIARFFDGSVLVLQVVSPQTEFLPYPLAEPAIIQTLTNRDLEEARNYLESTVRLSSLSEVPTETEVILGQAAEAILSLAERSDSDAIIMCGHGYTGMKRWIMGSVAEKVIHHAPVPVLLLREGESVQPLPHPYVQGPFHALVPLDGSARAKAALEPAAQLIAALSAPARGTLHLTRVVVLPEAEQISTSEREEILRKAKKYLSSTVEHIREGLVASSVAPLDLSITWSVTIDDDIASGIVRVAETGEDAEGAGIFGRCDLIAMATHGYAGIQRWAMGSVTERVLHATRLPLLIVRPQDMKDKQYQSTIAIREVSR
jgi:nucleotide-binding universal stress UspA family protein